MLNLGFDTIVGFSKNNLGLIKHKICVNKQSKLQKDTYFDRLMDVENTKITTFV